MFNAGLVDAEAAAIDYGLVDFVAHTLTPQIYENVMLVVTENYALLGERASDDAHYHQAPDMLCGVPAPDCIIPALFDVDALETCGIVTEIDPREWIVTFVKMFEAAEPRTSLVNSVALIHEHCDGPAPASNLSPAARPSIRLEGRDVPTFLRQKTTETKADRFLLENTNMGKRLDIHKWKVEETAENVTYKHCAFLLNLVDV